VTVACDARVVSDVGDVGPRTVVGLSTSLKPGRDGRSAARAMLSFALGSAAAAGADAALVDLHEHPAPPFDGRVLEEYGDPALDFLAECTRRAGGLLMNVPAYWSGVSGVWKNLVDVLCGPAYDMSGPIRTVFTGKPVGLLVVGADDDSASLGAVQALAVMASTGARIVGPPVVVANPRRGLADPNALSAALIRMVADLVRDATGPLRGAGGEP
jgi:NAD(P)H-dependent FMN reductase